MVKIIKKELRTWRGKAILSCAIAAVSCTVFFSFDTVTQAKQTESVIRVIEIEIKDMMFGRNNPDIYVSPGETVRFVVINMDPGMLHDFRILGTDVKTRNLKFGQKDSVVFRAPQEEFELVYICTWHAIDMVGKLLVRSNIPVSSSIALN